VVAPLDKFYLLSAGEIRFVLDGEAFVITAGDFCCVARGRRFSDANHGSDVATLVLVQTPPFDLNEEVFLNDVPSGRLVRLAVRDDFRTRLVTAV
jgi:mannose-6-phosphate isomerase-like protein (cupin superfamily)